MEKDSKIPLFIYNVATGTTHPCLASKDDSVRAFKKSVMQTIGLPEGKQVTLVLQGRNLPDKALLLGKVGVYPMCTVSLVSESLVGGSAWRRIHSQGAEIENDGAAPSQQQQINANLSQAQGLNEVWAQTDNVEDPHLPCFEPARTISVYARLRRKLVETQEQAKGPVTAGDVITSFLGTDEDSLLEQR